MIRKFLFLSFVSFAFSCANSPKKSESLKPKDSPSSQKLNPATGEFWDNAYKEDAFVFGIKPNVFFTEHLKDIVPGTLLLPGEGEGRNAVFAAKKGWKVDAYDLSSVGKIKADKLAKKYDTSINYWVGDFTKPKLSKNKYDIIAVIFLHLPEDLMRMGLDASFDALKPNGKLVLEIFAEGNEKIAKFGPKNAQVLYTTEEIERILSSRDWKVEKLEVLKIELDEGRHQGKALVLRLVARK